MTKQSTLLHIFTTTRHSVYRIVMGGIFELHLNTSLNNFPPKYAIIGRVYSIYYPVLLVLLHP